ncbi:unnamed protein product [Ambrosiozyma monospora]|uniref:Unnamed protein product n=1 Tax=Ambrosiozyma monospora TaxID=43982 RepID=A0A9W6YWJ5_AMBMO|nr:unnamed protein product [Ambrosiozyma monospora]
MFQSKYQLSSSKAIALICDDCRSDLDQFLPNFEEVINELVNSVEVEPLIRERIINSYASIIQGVKDPQIQGENLIKILNLVDGKAYQVVAELNNANGNGGSNINPDVLLDYLTSLITCLASIAKGMQVPDELEDYYTSEQIAVIQQYWSIDQLGIRNKILHIISTYELNDTLVCNLTIMEQMTYVFKYGLTESIPGPFVFNTESILQFIIANFNRDSNSNNNSNGKVNNSLDTYPLLYNLYDSLIVSRSSEPMISESMVNTLDLIFFTKLEIIKADPDMIQSSINLFSSILAVKPSLLISPSSSSQQQQELSKQQSQYKNNLINPDLTTHQQPQQDQQPLLLPILQFTISNFQTNEKFVLRSLSTFWTKLINLRKGSRSDHMMIKRLFNETDMGQVLTFNLIKYMLLTTRSNLEYFTDVLRVLIAKFPMGVSNWLKNTFVELNNERQILAQKQEQEQDIEVVDVNGNPDVGCSGNDVRAVKPITNSEIFIKKLLLTRGNRECRNVIKDFWLCVNGLIDY